MDTEPNGDDEEPRSGAEHEGERPRHSLSGPWDPPSGPWKTWLDIPLVLRAPEVALLLHVSRSTAYVAMNDGTIPSFSVRGTLRCLRIVVWAVANGEDPWKFLGRDPFDDGGPLGVAS